MPDTVIEWTFNVAKDLETLRFETNDRHEGEQASRELKFATALAAAING